MNAVQIHRFGGPDVLTYEHAPRPRPKGGELLIRVYAAGVNPADTKTRSGGGIARRLRNSLPVTLGWDVSGVVEGLGVAVNRCREGDEVFGFINFPDEGGGYAEYVTCPASQVTRKPDSLNHVEAAGLPLVAVTVWQAIIDWADLMPGQRILIHGAAGGVGHIAVQIAKWRGAYVIGTASGRNERFLDSMGVDESMDYQKVQFSKAVKDVDVVLDTIGGDYTKRSAKTLRKGGQLVSLVNKKAKEIASRYGARGSYMLAKPNGFQLEQVTRLVDAGYLKPFINHVYPLREARLAHAALETGHARGKIVLQVHE